MKYRMVITGITDTRKAVEYFRHFCGFTIPLKEALDKTRGPFPVFNKWIEIDMNVYQPMTTEELLKWKRLQENGIYKAPDVDPSVGFSDEEKYGIVYHYEYTFTEDERKKVEEALKNQKEVDESFKWLADQTDDVKAKVLCIVGARSNVYA